jgi:hypothetical protein
MKRADANGQAILGHDPGLIRLQSVEDNRRLCADMTAQISRQLDLLTHDLEKRLFDQQAFLAPLRLLATRSRHSRIRILVQNPEPAIKQGHRLIELARRLTSSIDIRVPNDDWLEHPENFLLADRSGYLHRELSSSFEASADYYAPLQVEKLRLRFDTIWESSQPTSELRRLYL